jgi:hypothetical protein
MVDQDDKRQFFFFFAIHFYGVMVLIINSPLSGDKLSAFKLFDFFFPNSPSDAFR